MPTQLRNKEYNVRVLFDENGEPVIGMCQGFYKVGSNVTDFRPVPTDVIIQIAKKLGIKASSELPAVKRKSPRKTEACVEQQSFENFS